MARLHVSSLIVLAILAGGCLPEMDRSPQGPAQVSMATHISAVHNVRIGENDQADIVVVETNAQVRVRFDDVFLRRVADDCLMVLRFPGPERTFDKPDYLAFLDQLHAYLTLTPVKPRPNESGPPTGPPAGGPLK